MLFVLWVSLCSRIQTHRKNELQLQNYAEHERFHMIGAIWGRWGILYNKIKNAEEWYLIF